MEASRQFDQLEAELFKGWVARNPLLGSELGLHEFDDKLPAAGIERIQDDVRFLKGIQGRLAKMSPKGLPSKRQVDFAAAKEAVDRWLVDLEEVRTWERIPDAPFLVGHSIYQILGRTYAPLHERFGAIISRMEKLPKYVKGSVSKLRTPIKMLLENELETVTRLAGFFYKIREIAKENLRRRDLSRMLTAVDRTQDAVEELCDTLVIDLLPDAAEHWSMGEAAYRRALRAAGIDRAPEQLLRDLEKAHEGVQRRLREFAKRVKRKTSPEDIRDAIKSRHPASFEEVLDFARDTVKRARQFVSETKFATIPASESLFLVETPSYLRNIHPLSVVWPPGRFEKTPQGYLFLTPPDCDSSRLREHNYASLSNMVVRLAYPGRHLGQVVANRHSSPLRCLVNDPQASRGWSLWCESKMKASGFDDTPEISFMQLCDQNTDTVRALVDLKVALGRLTPKEAVSYLAVHTGTDWICAEAEIRRLQLQPTCFVAPILGRDEIGRMETRARQALGARYADGFFHDAVLSSGALPLPLVEQELMAKIEDRKRRATRKMELAVARASGHLKVKSKSSPKAKPKPAPKVRPKKAAARKR
jgi:uncharacterized protein (DUF885 family)